MLSNNDGGFVPKGSYCLVCGTYICEKVIELLAGHLPVMSDLYFPCLIFYFIHCPVLFRTSCHCPELFWMSFLLCFFFFLLGKLPLPHSEWLSRLYPCSLYTRILKFEGHCSGLMRWFWCSSKIHVHREPQNVTLFGNGVCTDIVS